MSSDLNEIKRDIHDWILSNSADEVTGAVPTSAVIDSMHVLLLALVTEAMVIIAREATSNDIWAVTDKLNNLTKSTSEYGNTLTKLK